jgi:hypothetical protein
MHKPTHSRSHMPHHSQHPAPATRGGVGVKRKAHGAWGLGGPPRFPNNQQQQPARVTTSSARAWQCPSGLIPAVLRELALAREREERKRTLPYFHASRLLSLSPLVGSTPQIFRSLRPLGLALLHLVQLGSPLAQAGSIDTRCCCYSIPPSSLRSHGRSEREVSFGLRRAIFIGGV